ncbi:DUF1559 domain-containing protein [uncultured Rubinisphaera sp.]|uniref:DUF1559 family PulG-like putative transporter n=1 Tax=uncultured Rubinisphaera sp. TaxID=1678686 RepID=UPI0030DA6620
MIFTLATFALLVFPAIYHIRESARREQCKNTLKQLSLALLNYHDTYGIFPYGAVGSINLPPEKRWSWYLCIGNFWGHYGVPEIDYNRPWDDPALRPLILHTWRNGPFEEFDVPLVPFPAIKCPNGTLKTHIDGQPFTDYVGTAGVTPEAAMLPASSHRAGLWAYEDGRSLSDIHDGISNTLLAMETSSSNGCWLAGGPSTVREYDPALPTIGSSAQFGGLHSGGGMAVFADGHVSFLAESISTCVLAEMMTIADPD